MEPHKTPATPPSDFTGIARSYRLESDRLADSSFVCRMEKTAHPEIPPKVDLSCIGSADPIPPFVGANDRSVDGVQNDNHVKIVDILDWIGSPIQLPP